MQMLIKSRVEVKQIIIDFDSMLGGTVSIKAEVHPFDKYIGKNSDLHLSIPFYNNKFEPLIKYCEENIGITFAGEKSDCQPTGASTQL